MTKLKKIKKTANNQRLSPSIQFSKSLERYERIEKQNANFEQQILALAKRVMPKIEEYEIAKLESLHTLTLRLAGFFERKTLPEYLRAELELWIHQNLQFLTFSPFSEHVDVAPIEEAMSDGANSLIKHKHDKALNKLKKDGGSEQEVEALSTLLEKMRNATSEEELEEIMMNEFFSDLDSDAENEQQNINEDLFGDEEPTDDNFDFKFESNFNGNNNDFDRNESHDLLEKQLEKLLKSTSFNKIFRRIAKAIHPDLTQDEGEKQHRHLEMKKLIEARSNKDIARLIQMHTQILGEPPTDISDEDYPKLTKLLNNRIEKLKQEKYNVLDSNPFYGSFYEWFNAKTPTQENNKIQKYNKELKNEAKMYQDIVQEISSIKSLRPFLEARYHSAPPQDFY